MQNPGLRQAFDPAPDILYLDAATYGLPTRETIEALRTALSRWQSGTADFVEEWDLTGEDCRSSFAQLIGADVNEIALVPTISAATSLIAASCTDRDVIVIPDDEFTSVLFPFLVAAERNGTIIQRVPFDRLADAVTSRTTLVAFSHVRSQDGRVAQLDAICAAAERFEAKLFVDATHSVPFLPIAEHIDRIDYLACHGYKHLLCPRGAGFFYVRQDRLQEPAPWFANWRSVAPLYSQSYGGEFSPPSSAARFDMSLAWHSWVGAKPVLQQLVEWQAEGALAWPLFLANALATQLDVPPTGSSVISVAVQDADAVTAALAVAGVRAASRGGNVRLSPHVYNSIEEIETAAQIVAQHVAVTAAV